MEVTFVDDHVSLTGWPAWAEAGEALRATLGDADGGANCAAEMGFSPLAASASTAKPNKTVARSEWKRIVFTPCLNAALLGAGSSPQCPPHSCKDCGIARRRKLFLGAEFERGAMVPGGPVLLVAHRNGTESS